MVNDLIFFLRNGPSVCSLSVAAKISFQKTKNFILRANENNLSESKKRQGSKPFKINYPLNFPLRSEQFYRIRCMQKIDLNVCCLFIVIAGYESKRGF